LDGILIDHHPGNRPMNLHVGIFGQQPIEFIHPFDVPLHLFFGQADFALDRDGCIAINDQEVDLNPFPDTTQGHAAMDFADIEPTRTKEVDECRFNHRLDQLAQEVARVAKTA
jgi:hypothetical protein